MIIGPKIFFSIAGFDPSSGAGITADVKTAAAHDCYAVTCITALTVQTTERVSVVEPVRGELVCDTLFELASDTPPDAVRIGMLGSREVAEAVATFLETVHPPHVVLDPVLCSSSGTPLLDVAGQQVLQRRLLPLADVITPNLEEAAVLCGVSRPAPSSMKDAEEQMVQFCRQLHGLGSRNVVVTGGGLEQAVDLLSMATDAGIVQHWFRAPGIESRSTHGTGCAFASAIACNLAWGKSTPEAVRLAKEYVRQAMVQAVPMGRGRGPLNHLWKL